jgi:hypothetical protein
MPWHKVRVISEHDAKRRSRLTYWLNVSILASLVLIVLSWVGVINTFVGEVVSRRPFHDGIRAAFDDPDPSGFFTSSPELSAFVTLGCLVWLIVALSIKPRS